MAAGRVVEALDEVEDREVRVTRILEAGAVDQLALERGEEALGHRVVVRAADAAHRGTDAGEPAARAEGDRGVLTAAIGVMDESSERLALVDRHLERGEHELGAQVRRHRPAHDLAAEDVEHDRQVEEARAGRDVRDVGDPELVGLGGGEVTLDQVRHPGDARVRHRGLGLLLAAGDALDAGRLHQAGDALATDPDAERAQVTEDARRSVGAATRGVDRSDLVGEPGADGFLVRDA